MGDATVSEQPAPGDDGRRLIVLGAAAVAAVVAYFAFGMPGMDHGGGSAGMSSMEPPDAWVAARRTLQ